MLKTVLNVWAWMIRMPSKNLGLFFACVLFYSEYIYIHLFRLMGDPTVRMNNVSKLITFFNILRKYWHLAGPFCRAKAIKACIETLYSSSFHAVRSCFWHLYWSYTFMGLIMNSLSKFNSNQEAFWFWQKQKFGYPILKSLANVEILSKFRRNFVLETFNHNIEAKLENIFWN